MKTSSVLLLALALFGCASATDRDYIDTFDPDGRPFPGGEYSLTNEYVAGRIRYECADDKDCDDFTPGGLELHDQSPANSNPAGWSFRDDKVVGGPLSSFGATIYSDSMDGQTHLGFFAGVGGAVSLVVDWTRGNQRMFFQDNRNYGFAPLGLDRDYAVSIDVKARQWYQVEVEFLRRGVPGLACNDEPGCEDKCRVCANLLRINKDGTQTQLETLCSNMEQFKYGAGIALRGVTGRKCIDSLWRSDISSILGDPHFTGASGERYDVQGDVGQTYSLISDSAVQVNGKMRAGCKEGVTVLGEVGLVYGAHRVHISSSTISVDGEWVEAGAMVVLGDGSGDEYVHVATDDEVTVVTADLAMVWERKEMAGGCGKRIDMHVRFRNSQALPHGLLGQTVHEEQRRKRSVSAPSPWAKHGEGTIEGEMAMYAVSSMYAADDAFNRYGSEEDPAATRARAVHHAERLISIAHEYE